MNIAERAKGGEHDAFTLHDESANSRGRSAVTSPARTILILPSAVSTRSAPSLSKPRVVPMKLSLPSDTLTCRSKANDEFAHHSRSVCSAPPRLCSTSYRSANASKSPVTTPSPSGLRFVISSIDVAVERKSSGTPSLVRLMPMPTIAAEPVSVSTVSASMPHSLRSFARMSLGHLMSVNSPHDFISASETANADINGSNGQRFISNAGRSTMLKYSPASFGECQLRSSLPRPAVCSRAMMHKPSGAPALRLSHSFEIGRVDRFKAKNLWMKSHGLAFVRSSAFRRPCFVTEDRLKAELQTIAVMTAACSPACTPAPQPGHSFLAAL